jgi:hypothetical protein
MNIFVLDKDPKQAAIEHCDKHVVKMIVESAQMLSTAHRILDGDECKRPSKSGKRIVQYWELPDDREHILYKAVHMKHPCTIWSMESSENYKWHWDLFSYLCDEYTYRYGKIHSTDTLLRDKLEQLPTNIPHGQMTKFKLAMGSNPECMFEDPIKSYRAFYKTKQARFSMDWTNRKTPQWW